MNSITRAERLAAATVADPRYAALRARDPAADGRFFVSIRSTGIYCRPSCRSRPARPENVAFHDSAAAAEAAGFRPCKRCKPDQPPSATLHADTVAGLCRFIDGAEQPPTLAELAQRAGISPHHLHRTFKALTGLTPRAYAAARRAERVRSELAQADSVTDAIYQAGYGSNSRFYEQADALLGMTPSRFRARGAGLHIQFAIGQCALGAILVAQSERGICAVALGDDPDALMRELQARFANAQLIDGDARFQQLVAQVIAFVEAPALGLELPLDLRGTAFQQRVWQALRRIPAGSTASYGEIAQAIGAPAAVRAVAGACAANPVAVLVPCHRVLRQDGSLSGYRWGVQRKKALLDKEAGR